MVLEADPRWYEPPAWRDPWVEARGDGFEMLLTARGRSGPEDGRGVIGRARSADLRTWDVLPPVSEPGAFLHLEVPQRIHLGGAWRVLFCVTAEDHAAARLARPGARPQWGTHYLTAAERDGPYRLDREEFLAGDPRIRCTPGAWSRTGADGGSWAGTCATAPAPSAASWATRSPSSRRADGGLRLNRRSAR